MPFTSGYRKTTKSPSYEANGAVETKSAARSQALHLAQECRCNDNVRAPAGDSVQHGSECADFKRYELGADPGDSSNTGAEASNVDDDRNEDLGFLANQRCPTRA